MGNSCKRVNVNEKAKNHYKENKNLENEEEDKQNNGRGNIKNKGIEKEKKSSEVINNESKKEKKEENKIKKCKEEKDNISNDIDNFSEDEFTCNLKLEMALKKIQNSRNYKIELYEYKNSRKIEKKKIGQTESKAPSKDKIINFESDIIIPFHFSQSQPLEFLIKDMHIDDVVISTTLGHIVGSLRQTFRETLENGIIFEVRAILNDVLNRECAFYIEVSGALVGMKIGYSITSLGNQYDPINNLVYESEILENNKLVKFNESIIPISELSADDNLDDNIIQIEFKDMLHSNELGKYKNSINQLFGKVIDFDLAGNKKAKIICKRINFHSLLEYLERDLHIATTLFIDFSEIGEANTHHVLKEESIFENLMRNFLDILEPYNEDQFFHIYGYGFQLKKPEKKEYDPNMFPLTQKVEFPSVPSKEIKKFYNNFLKAIKFDKSKTNINLIIKKFNDIIKEDIDDYDIREYNILLLFANNDIIDEKEFVKDIIFSSTLPISIIIVGLGKGPYTKIEYIEKNFLDIVDYEGNKPQRKCIKFVSFIKNKKNVQNTVKNSLIDIPNEMIEYLGIKNIEPII